MGWVEKAEDLASPPWLLVLLTPADLSIFHSLEAEKSLSLHLVSVCPSSIRSRHLATCSGAFQFLEYQELYLRAGSLKLG